MVGWYKTSFFTVLLSLKLAQWAPVRSYFWVYPNTLKNADTHCEFKTKRK